MKATTSRMYMYFILVFVSSVFLYTNLFFAQEGDAPKVAWEWYYSRRAYPYDTVTSGAMENAVNQRKTLFQGTGFQDIQTDWKQIGPLPYGIFSGRIAHVVYDPRDPEAQGKYIYVTGALGGVWKTEDGGLNWDDISNDLPSLLAGAFTLDATRNILYFGTTGTPNTWFGAGNAMRIFMSTNDGDNWTSISNGIPIGTSIYKIVISPNDLSGNTLFAATNRGLYKTTDRGGLWIKVIPEDTDVDLICSDVCFSPDRTKVYAVGPSSGRGNPWNLLSDGIGIWRSDDGGNNFDPVNSIGFPHSSVLTATTLCAVSKAPDAENGLVWLISYDDSYILGYPGYVYKSTDYGQNFTSRNVGSNLATQYHLSLRASDVDKNICYAGNMWLHKTTDGSQSNWTCIGGYCGAHGDVKGFDINPFFPDKITEGNDGGVFQLNQLNPGEGWISRNQDLGSLSLIWGLASSVYDANFVAGSFHDFSMFSYNPDTSPETTEWYYGSGNDGDCGNMVASPFRSKHFISVILQYNQKLYYSTNGTDFADATGYAQSTSIAIEGTPPFTYHPDRPGEVYTVRFNQWEHPMNVHFRKSTDNGAYWGGDLTPFRQFEKPVAWPSTAPSLLAISQSNPNIMIMGFTNGNEFWQTQQGQQNAKSRLIKSTDSGITWEGIDNGTAPIVTGGENGTPNRAFSDVEIDPNNPNILYLTLSGYFYPNENEGHVFKSTDGGYNWFTINGNLPDIPVNDIMIHYRGTGANDKELIVATDAGIYVTNEASINWRELAGEFPNTMALHLDYNRLSGKLRTNTWGRGAWEYQLDKNAIYVQDKLYISDNVTLDKQIVVAPGGKLLIGHTQANPSMTIKFNNGAKIVVEDGGTLLANSNVAITLTSSGTWSGIEFHGTGSGSLSNVTFQNTATPIVAVSDGGGDIEHPDILIDNCYFNNAPVQITSRPNVTVSNSHFDYTSGEAPTVLGVISTGSDNVDIYRNSVLSSSSISSAGISVIYGTGVSVRSNIIQNMGIGISLSNSDAFVEGNTVSATDEPGENIGIGADNSYSGAINSNYVSNYYYGIKLLSSSPTLLSNNIVTSISNSYGIYCTENSSPRLRPDVNNELVVWDAGLNTVNNSANTGLYAYETSVPDLDLGCNTFTADRLYVDIALNWPVGLDPVYYYIRNNTWENPFSEGKIHIDNPFIYEPTGCYQERGGGGLPSVILDNPEPPQPFVVDYGNGIYDTLNTSTSNSVLSADQSLYHQGIKKELSGDFSGAVELYKNVVSGYRDSLSAIGSLKRILRCNDRMNSDSSAYSQLRSYYLGLAAAYPNDTDFSYISRELATKCLVRSTKYPAAITEYENSVSGSNDSLRILNAELNIIETYMLIPPPPGDAPGFTGRLVNLKPAGIMDGFRMLKEKLYRFKETHGSNVIPEKFSLSQNYPNPFNPLTKINFSLPNASKVTLKVYDILGRTVKELVNEFKDKGVYSVTFDGTGLASGVYFYTIEAGTFKETKKMVLVK